MESEKRRKVSSCEELHASFLSLPSDIHSAISLLVSLKTIKCLASTCQYLNQTVWKYVKEIKARDNIVWASFVKFAPRLASIESCQLTVDGNAYACDVTVLSHLARLRTLIITNESILTVHPHIIGAQIMHLPCLEFLDCPCLLVEHVPNLHNLKHLRLPLREHDRLRKPFHPNWPALESLVCLPPSFRWPDSLGINMSALTKLQLLDLRCVESPRGSWAVESIVSCINGLPLLKQIMLPGSARKTYTLVKKLTHTVLHDSTVSIRARGVLATSFVPYNDMTTTFIDFLQLNDKSEAGNVLKLPFFDASSLITVHTLCRKSSLFLALTRMDSSATARYISLIEFQKDEIAGKLGSLQLDKGLLGKAALSGHLDLVRLLLALGCSPTMTAPAEVCPLVYACQGLSHPDRRLQCRAIAQLLRRKLLKPYVLKEWDMVHLCVSGVASAGAEISRLILEDKVLEPPSVESAANAFLKYANRHYGNLEAVYEFLHEIQPNYILAKHSTRLSVLRHCMATPINLDSVRWLLRLGVPATERDAEHPAALHVLMSKFSELSRSSFGSLIRICFECGVDFQAKDDRGVSAIDVAFRHPSHVVVIEVFRDLLRAGVVIGQEGMNRLARVVYLAQDDDFLECLYSGVPPATANDDPGDSFDDSQQVPFLVLKESAQRVLVDGSHAEEDDEVEGLIL